MFINLIKVKVTKICPMKALSYLELTKPRLSALVTFTALVGYFLGSNASDGYHALFPIVLGTFLSAGGANALNQLLEAAKDARMARTMNRPIPSGRIQPIIALVFGLTLSILGVFILLVLVNSLAGLLALTSALIYLLVYTPLKVVTPFCTIVGAVVGAIPPLIGWAGAQGTLGFGALVLASILFVWQIPHFLSLAWLYRADYENGGFKMLPLYDRHGYFTTQLTFVYTLALVPLSLFAGISLNTGIIYKTGSLSLSLLMLFLAGMLIINRSSPRARRMFRASIIYLPILLCLILLDRSGANLTNRYFSLFNNNAKIQVFMENQKIENR